MRSWLDQIGEEKPSLEALLRQVIQGGSVNPALAGAQLGRGAAIALAQELAASHPKSRLNDRLDLPGRGVSLIPRGAPSVELRRLLAERALTDAEKDAARSLVVALNQLQEAYSLFAARAAVPGTSVRSLVALATIAGSIDGLVQNGELEPAAWSALAAIHHQQVGARTTQSTQIDRFLLGHEPFGSLESELVLSPAFGSPNGETLPNLTLGASPSWKIKEVVTAARAALPQTHWELNESLDLATEALEGFESASKENRLAEAVLHLEAFARHGCRHDSLLHRLSRARHFLQEPWGPHPSDSSDNALSVDALYRSPEWFIAFGLPILERSCAEAVRQAFEPILFVESLFWQTPGEGERLSAWLAAQSDPPTLQAARTQPQYRRGLRTFFERGVLAPIRQQFQALVEDNAARRDERVPMFFRPILRFAHQNGFRIHFSEPSFESWRLRGLMPEVVSADVTETAAAFLAHERSRTEMAEGVARALETAFVWQRQQLGAAGRRVIPLVIEPRTGHWPPADPRAEAPETEALRARLADRPLSEEDEELLRLRMYAFLMLLKVTVGSQSNLTQMAGIAWGASLANRWSRSELQALFARPLQERMDAVVDWLNSLPPEEACRLPISREPVSIAFGPDAALAEVQNRLPRPLRVLAVDHWPSWLLAARDGQAVEAIEASLSEPHAAATLSRFFTDPSTKAGELAPLVPPPFGLATFSEQVVANGERRAILDYVPSLRGALEAANPGTCSRIERLWTTPLPKLTEGLDYDAVGGARALIQLVGQPLRVNRFTALSLKHKAAVFVPEAQARTFSMASVLRWAGDGDPEMAHDPRTDHTFDDAGRLCGDPGVSPPTGGGFLSRSRDEAVISLDAFLAGQPVGMPLAIVQLPDQKHEGEALGGLILFQPTATNERTGDYLNAICEQPIHAWNEGELRRNVAVTLAREVERIVGLQGRTFSSFLKAGFLHSNFHLGNSTPLSENEMFIHDNAGTVRRSQASPPQWTGLIALALLRAMRSVDGMTSFPLHAAAGGAYLPVFLAGALQLNNPADPLAQLTVSDLSHLVVSSLRERRLFHDDPHPFVRRIRDLYG